MNPRKIPTLPAIGALALIYFIAGKLALRLAFLHASASPVWPPAGIALAALLVLGSRVWPALFVGAFLVDLTTLGNILTSLGIASGNTLERSEERSVGGDWSSDVCSSDLSTSLPANSHCVWRFFTRARHRCGRRPGSHWQRCLFWDPAYGPQFLSGRFW